MNLASFDIFDTCIIRKCGLANNIFFLLSRKLYPDSKAKQECFFEWRVEAENIVRLKKVMPYPTLDDIYSIYPSERFSEYDCQYVKKSELEIEWKNLRKNRQIESIIKDRRSKGFEIAFISDMYLDSRFVRNVLEDEGLCEKGDRIYISSECKKSKSDGLLFDYVYKDLRPEYWCHYGDNKRSDFINARKKNIDAKLIRNTEYTPIEKYILKIYKNTRNFYLCSCLIGFARYARISVCGEENYDIVGFSSDVVIPIYLSFVCDILAVSEKEGFKRLYFLARDGWLLFHIAKMLTGESGNLELKYLYVSRKSLYLPTVDTLDRLNVERCFGIKDGGLTIEKIISYFKLEGFVDCASIDEGNKKNEKSRLNSLFSWLGNQSGNALVNQYIANEKQEINRYFRQEGLLDHIPYAFVDVGWKGSGLNAINMLQKRYGIQPSVCFYWHTFKRCRNDFPINFYTHNRNIDLPIYFISLVEDFLSANPQLSTVGYRTENGLTVPVFDPNSMVDNEVVAQTNKAVAEIIIACIREFGLMKEVSVILAAMEETLINAVMYRPYLLPIRALAKLKYYNERTETKSGLSKKLNLYQAFKYITGCDIHELWAEACICYTYPKVGKYLINTHYAASKVLRFVRRKLHS